MARPPRGQEAVDRALQSLATATTIEPLRPVQAVLFPLRYGLSLEQTAEAVGVSRGWACRLRNPFIAGNGVGDKGKSVRGGRRRENFSHEREAERLKPFLESANHGGIWGSARSNLRLKPCWGAQWRCRRWSNGCTGITGANSPQIKDTPKAILKPRMTGKKRPETLLGIRQNGAKGAPLRRMFQDEARFGRINDVRRCWAPKPLRPLCQALLTHETP